MKGILEENLIDGIKKSLLNAIELNSDANILKEHNRNNRAYFLYQIAIEEIGKALQIFDFLIDIKGTSKNRF